MTENEQKRLVEVLATEIHAMWSRWMTHLFDKCPDANMQGFAPCSVDKVIPAELVARWVRQSRTHYSHLSEKEKDSDRKEANCIIDTLKDECFEVI